MHYKSAKKVWYKLNKNLKRDEKVKQAKLQTSRMIFEELRMNEEESIT